MSKVDPSLAALTVALTGPKLLGYFFNWALFGVLSVQVYFYSLAFPNDRRTTKALVAVLFVLELTQTILLTQSAFAAYAIHFGDLGFLNNNIQLLAITVPIFSGLLGFLVQMYFGYLLRTLSGWRLLGLTVALFAVLQFSAATVAGVQAFILDNVALLPTKTFVSEIIWLAGGLACDLIIACGMIIVLYRKDTKLPATHTIITKLVRVIVETGFLIAISALVQLILFIVVPDKPYYTCVGFVLSKLYSNSVLAILNSRIRIEGVHASRSSAQMTAGSSLAFYGQSATSRRVTLPPLAGVAGNDKKALRSRIVDVHIQCETEAWTATDDTDMIPLDESVSKNASTSRDLNHDFVLSKA